RTGHKHADTNTLIVFLSVQQVLQIGLGRLSDFYINRLNHNYAFRPYYLINLVRYFSANHDRTTAGFHYWIYSEIPTVDLCDSPIKAHRHVNAYGRADKKCHSGTPGYR